MNRRRQEQLLGMIDELESKRDITEFLKELVRETVELSERIEGMEER